MIAEQMTEQISLKPLLQIPASIRYMYADRVNKQTDKQINKSSITMQNSILEADY